VAAANDELTAALERRLLTRALAAGDFGALHLLFDVHVLDRYRERGAKLVRTRTVGRVSMPQWSLDMGIVAGDTRVHVRARDLLERVPEAEHEHWVSHLVPSEASRNYLQMSLVAAACIDDGDTEAWE
jgi:hypothetical protein